MSGNTQDVWKMTPDHMKRVLAKAQESIKWPWFVIMGYALYNATEESYKVILRQSDASTNPPIDDIHYSLILPLLIAIFVFLPTFIRFFFGDTRYIDEQYAELRQRLKDDNNEEVTELLSRSRFRRGLDAIFLLCHGITIALLSLAISRPELFFVFYWLLLSLNCVFLFTTIQVNKIPTNSPDSTSARNPYQEIHYKAPRRDAAVKFWLWNNLIFWFMFAALYWFWERLEHVERLRLVCRNWFLYGFVVLFLLNSVIDLVKQLDFYLPKLALIDKEAPSNAEAPSVTPLAIVSASSAGPAP
jgi:hypothetical protein